MRWAGLCFRILFACYLIAFFPIASRHGAAFAASRYALVIANSDYSHTKKLANPINDGALIAGKLQDLGFQVQYEKNLNARQLSEVIQKFAAALNKEDEALFYYGGHGLQFGGENFLVGIDAGRDGKLRYRDVETGNRIRELAAPNTIPYSARINSAYPDHWVLMGDMSGRLIAWDLKQNKIITDSKLHNGAVHAVDYQPNGKGNLLSGGGDGELKIRLENGKRQSIHAHTGAMFVGRYSRSGTYAYTAGADRKVKVWESAKLQVGDPLPKYVLEGHLRYVLTADMSQDENMLVSGGADKAINLWSVKSGSLVGQLTGHTGDVEAVAFTPNGKFVVSASEDKTVRVWSVEGNTELVRNLFPEEGTEVRRCNPR